MIERWVAAHPRFHFHLTPTGACWLNLVERWFGELTARKIKRGAHRSVRELNADIRDWIDRWNENPKPYMWTKTAEQILETIAGILQTNHRLRTLVGATNFTLLLREPRERRDHVVAVDRVLLGCLDNRLLTRLDWTTFSASIR